jgi:hypothetical protein
MAGLDATITVSNSEYRPCIVRGQKALFHQWIERAQVVPPSPMVGGHSGGVMKAPFGIIEREDGKIVEVDPESIQFADNHFKEFAFERAGDE